MLNLSGYSPLETAKKLDASNFILFILFYWKTGITSASDRPVHTSTVDGLVQQPINHSRERTERASAFSLTGASWTGYLGVHILEGECLALQPAFLGSLLGAILRVSGFTVQTPAPHCVTTASVTAACWVSHQLWLPLQNRCHEFIIAHSVHVKCLLLVFCFNGGCLFFANVLCLWELSLVFSFI